jgi:hypothetical protein
VVPQRLHGFVIPMIVKNVMPVTITTR